MFEFLGCSIDAPADLAPHFNAVVKVESSGHPYAIGVVGGMLSRQPQTLDEALEAVKNLRAEGYNYSVGLAQVNKSNFAAYGLHDGNIFDTCTNLRTGAKILQACYRQYADWKKAYSCYYSGNAVTGFQHGYVNKVIAQFHTPLLTATQIPPLVSASAIRIQARATKSAETIAKTSPKTAGQTLLEQRLASPLSSLTSQE